MGDPTSQHLVLLGVLRSLQRYQHWSAEQAVRWGLTSQQQHILLAVRGHHVGRVSSTQGVAYSLQIGHARVMHVVGELVQLGLVSHGYDAHADGEAGVRLTGRGERLVARLSATHLVELQSVAEQLELATEPLRGPFVGLDGHVGAGPDGQGPSGRKRLTVQVTSLGRTQWNFTVRIPEDSEDELGFEVYASLEDRFGAAPGVKAAIFEDRRTCLVCADPHMSTATLQMRLQAAMDMAVTDADA